MLEAGDKTTKTPLEAMRADENSPNFFLMTLRIFFWSNFLGSPCTVVKVLRPLRSDDDKLESFKTKKGVIVVTYAGSEYGYSSETDWSPLSLRRRRRRGLLLLISVSQSVSQVGKKAGSS